MAIGVVFGKYSGEKEVVEKTISDQTQSISCQMLNTDILNPVLQVDSSRVNYTYCEIATFGRKYFIESCESIAGGHCILHCHVDVLSTYASGIKGMECLVLRNEDKNKWKRDEVDKAIIVSNKRIIEGWNFDNPIVMSSSDEYILGTI